MFMIELGLLIVVCLLIDNPNKECIIVPFINKAAFILYAATLSFYCFPVFKNKSWIALIIYVLLVPTTPPTCCNN
jgi:hypothetical protein